MILENVHSLIELFIFGTVCQMLQLMFYSVDVFKSRLDNYWMFQDVKYDYTADRMDWHLRSI